MPNFLNGPTLDQPTLADCRVVDGCGQTDCADETHTVRPMTVDDLIGLVKQLDGAEVIVSKVADWTVLTEGTWLVVPIPDNGEEE